MNIVMSLFGSIPVRGVKAKNAIHCVVQMLKESQELHIIISPEGTRKKSYPLEHRFLSYGIKSGCPYCC